MSFRARLLLGVIPLAVVPPIVLSFGIRAEVDRRLIAQYDERVGTVAAVVEEDLARESRAIASRLAALGAALADDNRIRVALLDDDAERRYLLDYAGRAIALAGLDALQVQDEDGRILSSGHFRNDYDRVDAELPAALAAAPDGYVLGELRTPAGSFLALLRGVPMRIGPRTVTLVGGTKVDERFLGRLDRGADLRVTLISPAGSIESGHAAAARTAARAGRAAPPADLATSSEGRLVREVVLPFVADVGGNRSDAGGADAAHARFIIVHSLAPLVALRASVDRWFLAGTAGAALLALVLAFSVAARLSRPLAELARRTQRLDLDRLDVDFSSRRRDEVGTLTRTLGALTQRLRASVARLRDAERRATVGELARQVNHDVRNGLTPIRNIMHHLAQLARSSPAEMPAVFLEREPTLDASISYLHSLASSYARLSPRLERRPCDMNEIVREVLRGMPEGEQSRVRADLATALPVISGDPVALRRVVENLVSNAIESLESRDGAVVVSTRAAEQHGERRVRTVVADTGHGIAREQLDRIFDDFYTTRERGTGLGLSIVRRIVADLGGSVNVESEPGRGTRFTIDLPAATGVRAAGGAAVPGEPVAHGTQSSPPPAARSS